MHVDRATAQIPVDEDIAPRPALTLVPDTLETLLTEIIAQRRSLPDITPDCRRDAIATIEIARAVGLLKPRPPHLSCAPGDRR